MVEGEVYEILWAAFAALRQNLADRHLQKSPDSEAVLYTFMLSVEGQCLRIGSSSADFVETSLENLGGRHRRKRQ